MLVPALGAVAGAWSCDVLAPRLVRLHAAVGVLALAAGHRARPVPGALRAADDPLRTLCLPAPDGACLYEAGPLASALQLGALGSALVVLLLSWPGADPRDHLRGGPAVLVSLVLAATAGAAGVAAAARPRAPGWSASSWPPSRPSPWSRCAATPRPGAGRWPC